MAFGLNYFRKLLLDKHDTVYSDGRSLARLLEELANQDIESRYNHGDTPTETESITQSTNLDITPTAPDTAAPFAAAEEHKQDTDTASAPLTSETEPMNPSSRTISPIQPVSIADKQLKPATHSESNMPCTSAGNSNLTESTASAAQFHTPKTSFTESGSPGTRQDTSIPCLLYTSDAADE